jgi:mannose-6-phosphate isomerase-like protein (cupin superfamily)
MIPVKKINNMPQLIETYLHEGEGYNPFFIKDDWQVAQLNYVKEQDPEHIIKMDMHLLTDEIFILLKGNAVLIGAFEREGVLIFECKKMLAGITYNIPVNTWHNVAMERKASMIIVEKSNTHLGDFVYRKLNREEEEALREQIHGAFIE